MKRQLLASLAVVGALAAGSAHAGHVSWSVGINAPLLGAVVGAPAYPAYSVAPQPVYAPPPVVYAPPPVAYAPAVVYAPPAPVVYRPYYRRRVVVPAPVYAPRGYYGGPALSVNVHGGGRY